MLTFKQFINESFLDSQIKRFGIYDTRKADGYPDSRDVFKFSVLEADDIITMYFETIYIGYRKQPFEARDVSFKSQEGWILQPRENQITSIKILLTVLNEMREYKNKNDIDIFKLSANRSEKSRVKAYNFWLPKVANDLDMVALQVSDSDYISSHYIGYFLVKKEKLNEFYDTYVYPPEYNDEKFEDVVKLLS